MKQDTPEPLKPHEYDGIREYDNRLPRWWLGTFFLTLIFGTVYWFYYHVLAVGKDQKEEYDSALSLYREHTQQTAQSEERFSEASLQALMADPQAMAEAKTLFVSNCAACHGASGEGGIGPNLHDEIWLHGHNAEQLLQTIEAGVAEKGMPRWKGLLSREQIKKLAAYIRSLTR